MTDLSQALEWWDEFKGFLWVRLPNDDWKQIERAFEAARERIDSANLDYRQGRRVAYSIGIAFPPGWDEGHIISINANEHRQFEPGMTFHLLATLHRPEFGGIGFSDTILVTHRGVETLTDGLDPELVVRAG